MSNSVRPHRQQPTRLPRPWDSPGKSTGVGCHFLLQCLKVKSESEVAQSCPTLSNPMDCSPPGSSHGLQTPRILRLGTVYPLESLSVNAVSKSRVSSQLPGWRSLRTVVRPGSSQVPSSASVGPAPFCPHLLHNSLSVRFLTTAFLAGVR